MKKILQPLKVLLAVFSIFLGATAFGQVANYTFSQSSGTYTPITGGTIAAATTAATTLDSEVYSALPIGFTFNFNGSDYTTFGLNVNGWISMGSTAPTSTSTPISGTTNNIISAISGDLYGRQFITANTTSGSAVVTMTAGSLLGVSVGDAVTGTGTATGATVISISGSTVTMSANAVSTGTGRNIRFHNGTVRYQMLGVAPNRTLVVQFSKFSRYATGAPSDYMNFQIRLNETSNTISVVYDIPYVNASVSREVGLRGASSTDYNNRSTTTNWSATTAGPANNASCTLSGTVFPASGQTFIWTPAVCGAAPISLNTTLITSSSATTGWTAASPAPAAGYDYYIGPTATTTAPTFGTTPTGNVSGTNVLLSSLTSNTSYSWWVRSRCDATNQSAWVSGGSFTTTQIPATIPYTQDFSGANSFSFVNGTQANQWVNGSATGNPGNSIYISNNGIANAYTVNSASVVQAYRDISIPTGTTVANFSFDWKGIGESTYDYFRVWLVPASFTPTAGTQISATSGFMQLGGIYNQQSAWQTYNNTSLDLSSFAGTTMRLVYEWRNDTSVGTQAPAAIDNISLTIPACTQLPSGLSSTVLTTTTATLSWTAASPAPAEGYDYYYNTSATAPTTATAPSGNSTGTTANLTGLTPNTTYNFWVRSRCDATSQSAWVSGGTFLTGYCDPTNGVVKPVTYINNFSTSLGFTDNISNLSGATNGTYQDNYATMRVQAITGSTINYSIDIVANANAGKTAIWIDWNNNLQFEADERVAYNTGNNAIITGSITVPPGTPTGDYRMRVKTDRLTAPDDIDPCGPKNNRSETENYKFSVVSAPDYRVYTTNTGANNTINDTLDIYFEDYDGINNFYTFGQTEIWMYSGLQTVDGIFQYQPTGQDENNLSTLIKFTQTSAGVPNVYKATVKLSDYYCPVTPKNVEGINLYFRNQFDAVGNNRTANLFLNLTDATLELNAPTLTATTTITQTTATINWTAPIKGAISGYEYYYSTDPTTPVAGTTASGSTAKGTATANLTGLTAATDYNFWVRTLGCYGEKSVWSVAGTFTTLCPITPITVMEGFNGATIPACWTVQLPASTNINFVTTGGNPTTNPFEGTGMVKYRSFNTSTDERLMSLPMSSTGSASVDVEFMWRNDNTAYTTTGYDTEGVQIQYSLNGTNWLDAPGGFFKRSDTSLPVGTAAWSKKTITLPAVVGNKSKFYVGFNFISEYGDNMYMDAVVVQTTPKPITVTSSVALPICSGTSTTLTASSAAAYTYTWSPAIGLSSTTGASVVATPAATTTYTVTGTLGSVSTTKDFTVTVNPAPTDISITETPVSTGGVTACDLDYVQLTASGGLVPISSPTPLLSQDFATTTTTLPPGWTQNNSDIYTYWEGFNSNAAGGTPNEIYLNTFLSETFDYGTYALKTPLINATSWSGLSLSFKSYIDSFDTFFKLVVQTSPDGLTGWTDRWSFTPTSSGVTPGTTVNVDLSALDNQSALYVRFALVGFPYDLNEWSIDDVVITGSVPGQQISWSPITGLYTDTALTVPYVANANVATVYAAPDVATNFVVSAAIGACGKLATSTSIIRTKKVFTGAVSNAWNLADNWFTKSVPSIDKCVSIPAGKSVEVDIPTAAAKSVSIAQTGQLTVKTGQALTVKEGINIPLNNVTNTNLIVENDANLLQVDNVPTNNNIGNAKVNRYVTDMDNVLDGIGAQMDYVYWGSPVTGQGLQQFSPGTPANRIFQYRESNDRFYAVPLATEPNFLPAKGYAIRAEVSTTFPENPVGYDQTYVFNGVPNNGDYAIQIVRTANGGTPTVPIEHGFNLVGNPYPSNIVFNRLFAANSTKIKQLAYFWTNNNYIRGQQGNDYVDTNYAIYNGTGGSAASGTGNTVEPDGNIKVGQGFIIQKLATGTATLDFKNSYGSGQELRTTAAGTFYNKNEIPKDRFWLQLISQNDVRHTQLIGYVEGATNDFDVNFDAEALSMGSDLFYSKLNDKELVIQGKSLFNVEDKVQLGSNFYFNGNYTIGLKKAEGVFANGQVIYLKDNLLQTYTNLQEGTYTFSATKGISDGRFEIVYKTDAVLVTDATTKNGLNIYRDADDFVVRSSMKDIKKVEVFEASGRLVYTINGNSKELRIDSQILVNGIYIVKAILKDDSVVSAKIRK